MATRSWTTRQLGLAAAAEQRHHPVADGEPVASGPRATTSPAISRPGMSGGLPGRRRVEALPLQQVGGVEAGRPHPHEHLARAGSGSGFSVTAISPSLTVAARTALNLGAAHGRTRGQGRGRHRRRVGHRPGDGAALRGRGRVGGGRRPQRRRRRAASAKEVDGRFVAADVGSPADWKAIVAEAESASAGSTSPTSTPA